MKKFPIKQLFSYGAAIFIQKFAAFLILPIIAGYLSLNDFGLVNQIVSLGGFYILIVMFGLDESIAKKGFDSDEKRGAYMLNGFVLLALNITIFCMLTLFFSDFFYINLLGNVENVFIVLSIALVSSSPFYLVYLKVLRLSNKGKEFFLVVLAQVVIQTTLMLSLIVGGEMGAKGFILSHLISSALCMSYVFFRVRIALYKNSLSIDVIKDLYSYGSKVAPHAIATWGLWGFTVVYTGKVLGSEASAHLVAINYIPLIASVASYAFFYTYQPWLYENLKTNTNKKLIHKSIIGFALVFFIFLLVVSIFSEYIFNFLFDERYFLNYEILIYLLLACLFQFVGSMYTYVLYYFEDITKYVAITTIIGGGVNILFFHLFIDEYNLVGVALSFMSAQLIILIIRGLMAVYRLITM
jgi:O-antigen/teichoic acid export membrane protein